MRRGRLLTDDEIATLYASGLDSDSIGYRAGCSGSTVLAICRAMGVPIRPPGAPPPRKRLPLTDEQIIARYKAGESGPRIAQACDVAVTTVYYTLRRHGVTIRPSPAHRGHRPRKEPP